MGRGQGVKDEMLETILKSPVFYYVVCVMHAEGFLLKKLCKSKAHILNPPGPKFSRLIGAPDC